MAFVLTGNALLQPSSQTVPIPKGAVSSKLLSSQNLNRFSNVRLQRLSPHAASPVQEQSGTVNPQTQIPSSPSLKINPDRPDDRLPYRGAWFWVGAEMIHIMELPNPDPLTGRPAYGGRNRHTCVGMKGLDGLKIALEKAGIPFSQSSSGRPAMFARDPDGNCLEFTLVD